MVKKIRKGERKNKNEYIEKVRNRSIRKEKAREKENEKKEGLH